MKAKKISRDQMLPNLSYVKAGVVELISFRRPAGPTSHPEYDSTQGGSCPVGTIPDAARGERMPLDQGRVR